MGRVWELCRCITKNLKETRILFLICIPIWILMVYWWNGCARMPEARYQYPAPWKAHLRAPRSRRKSFSQKFRGNNRTWNKKTMEKLSQNSKPSHICPESQNIIKIYRNQFLLQTSSLGVSKLSRRVEIKNSRSKIVSKKTHRVLVVLKGSIGPGDVPTARVLRNGEWLVHSTFSALSVRHFYGSSSAFCARSYEWNSVQ